MIKRKKPVKDQRGITLVEVLICVIIVAMVIGPMTLNFTTANKNRLEAQNISDATNHAERLMGKIKERLSQDMEIAKKVEGNIVPLPTTPIDEKKRYNDYVKDYICDYVSQTAPIDKSLNDYLADPVGLGTYDLDQFVYQAIIWPMSTMNQETLLDGKKKLALKVDATSIAQHGILRLSSDMTNYKFDTTFNTLLTDPITFTTAGSEQVINDFLGKSEGLKRKVSMPNEAPTASGYMRIKIEDPENEGVSPDKGYILDESGSDDCYGIVIPVEGAVETLELDVTALLRGAAIHSDYTFKVENKTDHALTVNVIRSYERKEDGTIDTAEKEEINNKFHWVALNEGTGKTTFNFIDANRPEENYVIALFVRQKEPLTGKPGKLVKKMVDVFSYDMTYDERGWGKS